MVGALPGSLHIPCVDFDALTPPGVVLVWWRSRDSRFSTLTVFHDTAPPAFTTALCCTTPVAFLLFRILLRFERVLYLACKKRPPYLLRLRFS